MKLTHKFLLASAIVTVASSATSWAGGKEGGADPAPAVEEPSNTPGDEGVVDGGEIVDGSVVEDGNAGEEPSVEITILTLEGGAVEKGEVTEGEPSELVDPAVTEAGGPEVQRGEDKSLDPDVIFQTTALDGGGAGAPAGKAEAGFGSDERAAEIETKGAGISSVKSQKKGPVALVKKGRVFLR